MSPSILECSICGSLYPVEAVTLLEFFPSNHTCYNCCMDMRCLPRSTSCFGKTNSKYGYGYDKKDIACKELCPDRSVCKLFVEGGSMKGSRDLTEHERRIALKFLLKPLKPRPPSKDIFRPKSNIGKLFALCVKGCTMKQFDKTCEKLQANRKHMLRILRREEILGHAWTFSEVEGSIKITILR